MQIDSTLLQPVNNETLRTLAAIIREAELKFETRLTELIAASECLRFDLIGRHQSFYMLSCATQNGSRSEPELVDKLAKLSAVSRAGSQTNHELVPDKWEASFGGCCSFWAHGHMRTASTWHEWTTDVPTFAQAAHHRRCAARCSLWALLRWRGRLSRYGGEA